MIKVGDRVKHVTEGTGTALSVRRKLNIILVKWDSGVIQEHYLPYVHKVGA